MSLDNDDAGMDTCVSPVPANGTDERGINCGLLPMPRGAALADKLNAPGILDRHIQIHVSQPHVPSHTCANLAASARSKGMVRGSMTPAVAHAARSAQTPHHALARVQLLRPEA